MRIFKLNEKTGWLNLDAMTEVFPLVNPRRKEEEGALVVYFPATDHEDQVSSIVRGEDAIRLANLLDNLARQGE